MSTWYGASSVELRAGELRVVVVPELGGKIASLRFRGHEWLAAPAGDLHKPSYGDRFVEADMSGWDEMLPTIDGCVLPSGAALPDHGEVWSQPWRVERASAQELVCEVAGRVLPYEMRRHISAASANGSATLRLEYELRVTGREPVPLLWAAHPQFVVSPKTRLVMPSHVDGVWQVWPQGTRLAWPSGGQPALDGVPEGEGRKLYLPTRLRAGWCALEEPDGASLRLSWDPELIPYLGIWIDHALASRQPVVVLEPTTGYYDSLERADRDGRVSVVEPGRPLRFTLMVELRAAGSPTAV